MLEAICLLTAGVCIGRLWAWLKTATQVPDCPRCAIEDEGRRTSFAISAQARMAEEQMRQAAGERQQQPEAPRRYGDNEQWSSGRFEGR